MSRKIGHKAHTFKPPTGQEEGDYQIQIMHIWSKRWYIDFRKELLM
jgi:hypothetical protein